MVLSANPTYLHYKQKNDKSGEWIDEAHKKAYDENVTRFENAIKQAELLCGKVVLGNSQGALYVNSGKCKGCPPGQYGCTNPLGEGQVKVRMNGGIDRGWDEAVFYNHPGIVTFEEVGVDKWNTCYRVTCDLDKDKTEDGEVQVHWDCGMCNVK